MLLDFPTVRSAARRSADHLRGVIPAAMEMMDRRMTAAVEQFVHADLPVDAAAVLLVEVDGTRRGHVPHRRRGRRPRPRRAAGAGRARRGRAGAVLEGSQERLGAVARVAPNYYLHDCVVPRTRLVGVLERIEEIAAAHDLIVMNVFHAGDGNLHPLIAFDRRDAEQVERVHAAGKEIIEARSRSGVLSGEHGIGLEKRDFMPLTFDAVSSPPRPAPATPSTPASGSTRTRSCRWAAAAASWCSTPGRCRRAPGCDRGPRARLPAGRGRGAGRGDGRARVRRRRGRGTARAGAPGPPPDHELRTAGLRAVVAHEPADLTVTVEAGLPATDLAELAASAGQGWPQADIRPGSTVGRRAGRGGQRARAPPHGGRARLPARGGARDRRRAPGDRRRPDREGGRGVRHPASRRRVAGALGAIVQVTLAVADPRRAAGSAPRRPRRAGRRRPRALAGPARPASVLLMPGAVAVELIGPEEDAAA